MIGFVRWKMSVGDAFFYVFLIVRHSQKTLTTTADSLNATQCVSQYNYRGFNFGCMDIADSMTWIHTGYYGRTPSASPSDFCERPVVPFADACVPDPSGDRRRMTKDCNTYTNCQTYGKTYSDIVALCPSSSGGFPFAYVTYECLPRKQVDGIYIDVITLWESSPDSRNLHGKIFFKTFGYPYDLINKNVRCQVTVDGNTKVSMRLLDAYGHLLSAIGPCPYSLYLYSSSTNTYYEWCVNKTSWTIDYSIPALFPAVVQVSGTGSASSSQDIDIVFAKPYANLDAEGALWMLVEAVNVVDNSPGRNVNVSCGPAFMLPVRPTTTTTTTTTTPSTSTTTSTTARLPTSTTTTTTTSPAATTMTTTSTTTTPTSTATTTTPTTTTTTPPPTSTTTTLTTTSTTTMIPKTSRTTPTPSSTASATSSSVTSLPMTSRMNNLTSSGRNFPDVPTPTSNPSPTTTFNLSSTPTENATASNTSGAVELSSPHTNVIIGVVAAVGVVVIIVIVIVAAVMYRRNKNRISKPHPPMVFTLDSVIINNNIDDDSSSKVAASLRSREHIYDEIPDPSDTLTKASLPLQPHLPTSHTILRSGRGQSRKVSGVRVRFTTPEGDGDMVFFPGALSNISDDDKVNRQTAQNANEVHPRLIKNSSSSSWKKLSLSKRQDSVPSEATAAAEDSGVQLNPVYGFRPTDIYMY